jgi:DnaJ-domain-containing protein 1
MGILDRFGTMIRSYINSEDERIFPHKKPADPDLQAAYDELDEFLSERRKRENRGTGAAGTGGPGASRRSVPGELRGDFAELGVPFGASLEECKAAYKELLKKHHPDRHSGHAGNMQRATEKSARINAAYDRIVLHFQGNTE